MVKLLVWLWWNLYYAFIWICWWSAGKPGPFCQDLRGYLTYGTRCKWPWWKFKPFVWYYEDMDRWEVWFEDSTPYTGEELLHCTVHRCMDTGKIVGLTLGRRQMLGNKKEE